MDQNSRKQDMKKRPTLKRSHGSSSTFGNRKSLHRPATQSFPTSWAKWAWAVKRTWWPAPFVPSRRSA